MPLLQPENVEPPHLAVAAIARRLEEAREVDPHVWLLAFLDLLDKAAGCEPAEHLLATLEAAFASAPQGQSDVRNAAARDLRSFEARLRERLRAGASVPAGRQAGLEVLLVVPKSVERLATSVVFDCLGVQPEPFDSHVRYRRFLLGGAASPTWVTLVCIQEAGNPAAAYVVQDFVQAFRRPDLAVLCGMAMGLDADKVNVGDVVVASTVLDFNPRRVTHEGDKTRFEPFKVKLQLHNDLLNHQDSGRKPTVELFRSALAGLSDAGVVVPDQARESSFAPSVKSGLIVAGDALVENASGATLSALHDRLYALEMEGAGFARECERLGSPWCVVRGVADHGEGDRGRAWQGVATAAAASFVKTFLCTSWLPTTGDA